MKNIAQKFSVLCCVFLLLTIAGFGQTPVSANEKSLSPYEKMNLKFVIDKESPDEDVGFDNPKSFWAFSYELRFMSEQKELKGYKSLSLDEAANRKQSERLKLIAKNNKSFGKAWKKSSILVVKGKIPKSLLAANKNREIIIPVELTPQIKNILAAATDTWANPEFRISMKGTVATQTASGMKFKKKVAHSFLCPTKLQTKDSQLWMMNSCGIYLGLTNSNNKIMQSRTSRLQ